jgi:hypothetical protein
MVHKQSDITLPAEVLAKAERIAEKEDQPLSHMIKGHIDDYKE